MVLVSVSSVAMTVMLNGEQAAAEWNDQSGHSVALYHAGAHTTLDAADGLVQFRPVPLVVRSRRR